jgi:hypothetical protein
MSSAPIILDGPFTGQTFSPPTIEGIAAIESAIVTQLQSFLGAALGSYMIEVNHFPDKPEAYELRHRIGTCLVIYAGSEYGRIIDTGHVAQERTLEFEVGLRIRDLGWAFGGPPSGTSPGAYQIIEAVRMALLGFQPNTGCTKMRAMRERFIDRDRQGGVWVYSIWFSTRTVVVENFEVPVFPPFTRGRAFEKGGVTTIQVGVALLTFGSDDTINLGVANISAVTIKNQALSTAYTEGSDYTVDYVNGMITRQSGGIGPGATVAASYAYSDVAEVVSGGSDEPTWPHN